MCLLQVKFFDNIEPKRLVKDKVLFREICQGLENLTGATDTNTDPPWMECCVKSYMTEHGKCYQIFDTVLCMEDASL